MYERDIKQLINGLYNVKKNNVPLSMNRRGCISSPILINCLISFAHLLLYYFIYKNIYSDPSNIISNRQVFGLIEIKVIGEYLKISK